MVLLDFGYREVSKGCRVIELTEKKQTEKKINPSYNTDCFLFEYYN